MELVVDANILFSALLKNGMTRKLLLNDNLQLYTTEYIFDELLDHSPELERKTHTTKKKLTRVVHDILKESEIRIISLIELKPYREQAKRISPDPKDTPYFATALKMNCAIWSNDKALKQQQRIKIYSTEDIISLYS
ncbi:MAG: PIN domain-containing protein [Candidatus Thermoplasmatota archaeon]|nr:PIN domain-containing protein [Candidatus Thermoplasmatota archaeon]